MSTWNQNVSLIWLQWTSKNVGWIVASAAWSSLRGFLGGRALPRVGVPLLKEVNSMPLSSVVVSTLSFYFVIILITSSIQDTSRSIQLATAPNEALQEVFTVIGSVRQIFSRNFGLVITIGLVRKTFLSLASFVFVCFHNWLDEALHQQTSLL